jgi:alpha-glucosidase
MKSKFLACTFLNVFLLFSAISYSQKTSIARLPGESWWAGIVNKGDQMPFGEKSFSFNFYGDDNGNQASPLLLSTAGRYVWSEKPFRFSIGSDSLIIDKVNGEVFTGQNGNTLRSAYSFVSEKYFPPSGKMPDRLLFSAPQYNLWIELMYNPNQKDVQAYADLVLKNGFPAGVLMIDDNWTSYYGQFDFNKEKFPDPRSLSDNLHKSGFKLMVWITPFMSPDSEPFRETSKKKMLLLDNSGKTDAKRADISRPYLVSWWNGYSACLDLTNPDAVQWLKGKLDRLQKEYGIDGFKLDAGDAPFYNSRNLVAFKNILPNEHSSLWGEIGLGYSLNEYRAMWKMGGQPLVERLRDKNHSWEDLRKLIPNITTAGMLGYPFSCPDLIGGGEISSFWQADKLDQELFVRSAQTSALMPMMQFSAAPWRVLDKNHFDAVKKAVDIRMKYTGTILRLAEQASKNGEPVVRNLEYVFPHQGFENIKDQFMLGDSIMIAPIQEKNQFSRNVLLPKLRKGRWIADDGKAFKGGTSVTIDVPLDRLPVFTIGK